MTATSLNFATLSSRRLMREAVREFMPDAGELTGHALVEAFERHVETHLIQPTIIYDYPVEVSPPLGQKPDEPAFTERFEIYAASMMETLGNAFSELNDPQEQRRRFDYQLSMKEKGDEEAHQMDEDYLRALSYGMPPTGGEGIGIDRVTMLLTNEADPRRDSIPATGLRSDRYRRKNCGS